MVRTVTDRERMEREAKERIWFPKENSVALGILGYVIEGEVHENPVTLEDIVYQLDCNAASAVGSVYQLRRAGYVAERRASDRMVSERNAKWGRNVLRSTSRGRARFEKHEEEIQKAEEQARKR